MPGDLRHRAPGAPRLRESKNDTQDGTGSFLVDEATGCRDAVHGEIRQSITELGDLRRLDATAMGDTADQESYGSVDHREMVVESLGFLRDHHALPTR